MRTALLLLPLLAISTSSAWAQPSMETLQERYMAPGGDQQCQLAAPYAAVATEPLFTEDARFTMGLMGGDDQFDTFFADILPNDDLRSRLEGGRCSYLAPIQFQALGDVGMDGIAIRNLSQHAGRLGELMRVEERVPGTRRRVGRTLILLGAQDQADSLAAGLDLRHRDDELEKMVLTALAHWESDAAIPYCMEMLAGNNGEICALYLARRGHRPAAERIAFRRERLGDAGLIALSMLGHRPTLAVARDRFRNDPQPANIVAMANLGDRSGLRQLAPVYENGGLRWAGWLAFLQPAAARRAAVTFLRRQSSERSGETWENRAFAVSTRLQLGDRGALADARAILRGPDDGARRKLISLLGYGAMSDSYDPAESGTGLVVDPRLAEHLRYIFEMDAGSRVQAGVLWALSHNAR